MTSLKCYDKLPVHIVEYHNEVLPFIYKAIGSKHLPFQGIAVVHFDSHPDLGIPPDLQASDIFDKEKLFQKISIESWLLPAVYAGHINTIIWCKPPWADQISEGTHHFVVGKDATTNTLKVSSMESYFLSDGLYEEKRLLHDSKALTLHTVAIGASKTPSSLADILQNRRYILDVDLDFFSTLNPFRDMFSTEDMNTLTNIYWFTPPKTMKIEDVQSSQIARNKQLDTIWSWIVSIKQGETPSDSNERFQKLAHILGKYKASLQRPMEDEDYEIFHGAGCATDVPELPHHVSTSDEIDQLMQSVKALLHLNSHPPVLVTVARSSIDDYCPSSQVDDIQRRTELMLEALYKHLQYYYHYQDD